MAEMADDDAVANAFDELASLTDERIVPITYVNSTAAIKALTGRHGGACCTSSNVRNVFQWALTPSNAGGAAADKIFAIPDEHLARNTAVAMGYELDDCVLYDPSLPNGGLTKERMENAKFILWKGHCYVHRQFTPKHVRNMRERYPGITVIVHPECPREVVELADLAGSTEQIIRAVSDAPADTQWAIGTEANLVHRLAKKYPDRFIRLLSDGGAVCAQMARIDLPHLAWVLDSLVEGHPRNPIHVDEQTAADARLALQRMIDIKAVAQVTEPRK
jgi:quinolinate synthase